MNSHHQLEQYRENLANGLFETVISKAGAVVDKSDTSPSAEVALYALGEVYAHPEYDGRDYVLSQNHFEKLIENFPDSHLISEAHLYISLLETIAAKEKTVAAVKQKSLQKERAAGKAKKSLPDRVPGKVVENRNFEEAVEKNITILDKAGMKKPADEALYHLGLIYAHVDNPAKDYEKSQNYFQQLAMQFPDSQFAEEAQIWLGLFETIEKIQQIDVEIDQQKKQLTN